MLDDQDPRLEWLCKFDLSKSRVKLSSKPIVLLCGGKVKIKERPNDPDPPILSLRHAITSAGTPYEIFRPEEIDDWHSDGLFKDLMNFELELSGICSLIVIVLESEGSFVELGAFSQIKEIREKTIIIQTDEYVDAISFVNLGILRFLKIEKESKVKSYPFDVKNPGNASPSLINDIVMDIQEEIDEIKKEQSFKNEKIMHITVLIYELVKLFVALKESEIIDYLELLGVEIKKETFKRKIFLLKAFGLILSREYGGGLFYMALDEDYHEIRFHLSDKEKHFDRLRIKTSCLEFYTKNSKQRNRHRAITMQGGKRS